MATAQQVIEDAATIAGVLADGQTIGASMNATILRALNNMLQSWENAGPFLGLAELDFADTVRVPAADIRAIVLNLALDVFMIYQRPLRADVAQMAQQATNDLLIRYAPNRELEIPVELQVYTAGNILTDD